MPDLILDVLAVRTSLLDNSHADALRHLVATHLRALRYIDADPDDASYRMAATLQATARAGNGRIQGLVLPGLHDNLRLLASSPPELLKSVKPNLHYAVRGRSAARTGKRGGVAAAGLSA